MKRKSLVWLHRYLGLGMAGFLILSGGSGTIIAFERELDAVLNPSLYFVEAAGRVALPLDTLREKVEAVLSAGVVRRIILPLDSESSALIRLSPDIGKKAENKTMMEVDEVFVDPYSGVVLGARLHKAIRFDRPHFVPMVREFHESLYLDDFGDWLLGSLALIWFVSGLIGIILTLPRTKPFMGKWYKAWKVAPRRLNFDLHRAGGLWWLGVLLVISSSGVYLALGSAVVRPLVAQLAPLSVSPGKMLPHRVGSPVPHIGYDAALAAARQHLAIGAQGYQPVEIRYMAEKNVFRVEFMADETVPGWFQLPVEQIFIHAGSGQLAGQYGFLMGTTADKVLLLQLPLHSGKIFGVVGQGIVLIFGLVTIALSVTGMIIWWQRRRSRYTRRLVS